MQNKEELTLKKLREEKGLTQAAFAKELGVSAATIGNIESGFRRLNDNVKAKVKEVYGVDIVDAAEAGEPAVKDAKPEVKKAAKKADAKKAAAEKPAKTAKKADAKKPAEAEKTTEKVEENTMETKTTKKTTTKKTAEKKVEEKKAPEKKVEEKKAPAKKAAEKKAAAPKAAEKKTAEKKTTTAKKAAAPKATEIIIQSVAGGAITPAEILERVGAVDTIYVKVEENKAYWVKGEETGSVDLW